MTVQLPIYMDYHATTPVDPRVFALMAPYFTEHFGNAASRSHPFGWMADEAVQRARSQVARLIGASDRREVVFTSGATESDNLAVKGIADAYRDKGNHIITTAIEHKAILDTCKKLEREGFDVTYLDVDRDGLVDPGDVEDAITDQTILVSVMLANNEVGAVQPLADIGRITRARGVLLHSDAVQGIGKTPFDVEKMNVDLASVTAHKMYGPKGVGALYVRRGRRPVRITAQLDGGGHELGNRSGTLNVPAIVGFGAAADIAREEGAAEAERLLLLRERLRARLFAELEGVQLNGSLTRRLPGNLNVSFAFVEAEALLLALLNDVAVSSGSACTSASREPSYVLRALGVGDEQAGSSIRFGIGRYNTEEEIDHVAGLVVRSVNAIRARSSTFKEAHEGGVNLGGVGWAWRR